ncbi:MAG: 60S ribosomal protein L22 [Candidatus Bathyarchaeota archaeon]|nr:60S ribosomal protein L22 [Candidatus Bathyarchaeota archaeon]MCX8177130.1 60S ribosomal protein L22 [Candidatus Bathyarchaeota archaeon]MDW8193700.1 60S ribosomal protein L22 [Nitrososphaerota archaeon]
MMEIDISELKSEGEDIIKELEDFLKQRLGVEVEKSADNIVVKSDETPKRYLRVLLRKFLHKSGLKEYFRIISKEENVLKIKERKLLVEEE